MESGNPDPALLLPRIFVEDLRDAATREQPDTIAVIVLAGNPKRGLAMSVSSHQSYDDTIALLAHALVDEPALTRVIEAATEELEESEAP